jgi:phosphoglycerol transferase MdoB-like AlkP superfamily enzyme
MELFPNFHSSFANSMHARFATFSSLVPPNRYITYINPHIEAPSLFEVLKKDGCHVSLYYSSSRRYTRFADYLSRRGLDVFHDCDSMPGATATNRVAWGVQESATLDAIERQLDDYAASQQRFFLTYVPAAPHMPYDLPTKQFKHFEEGAPPLTGDYSGPYKNSLLYMDWVLSSILEHLEQTGLLDHTLVVITSDHGEMLGDRNKKLGHGWNLEPWLTNVPLILMDPDRRGCRTNFIRASQVDVLPTVLDRLGIPLPDHQFFQGASLDRLPPDAPRTILLNSHHQKAIIHGDRYYLYDPSTSQAGNEDPHIRVFELRNEGVRQVAEETNAPPAFAEPLRQLDAFQESLAVHYSRYRDWLTSSNLQFNAAFPKKLASSTAF